MPTLEDLRLRTGQLITEDWYDALVDYLEKLGYGGVISIYGYVMKDLVPIVDQLLNLGIPLKRFLEVNAVRGNFSDQVLVQGKAVVKDGDPITVSDFGSSAEADIKNKVQEALDASTDIEAIKTSTQKLDIPLSGHRDAITGKLDTVISKLGTEVAQESTLQAFRDQFKPVLLGKVWNVWKNEGVEIFGSDLTISSAGRARIKYMSLSYSYVYVKHRASGETVDVEALLNAGTMIPPSAWHEWDFTVMSGDKINLKISPASQITVIVYNIPNA